ncbi:putative membrane protein [Arthrobacter tumbae]|nr:putative membrane protein [Arthrobacter tumbae]
MTYASREDSVWTWYSVLLLAAVSAAFALLALIRRSTGQGFAPYVCFAVAAGFMSIDEATLFHEKFAIAARLMGLSLPFTFTWLVIGIPFAIVAGFVLLAIARRVDALLRRRLIVAGAVFLVGAVGFEMLGGIIVSLSDNLVLPGTRLLYQFTAMIEEGLEVAGALIALWATLAALDIRWTGRSLVAQNPTDS